MSRQGQSDFHALTASNAGVLGYDGTLLTRPDGQAWAPLAIPAEPHTLAARPDVGQVLATTTQGLLRSPDGRATWTPDEDAPLLQVIAWADAGTAVGVDPAGVVWTSADSEDVGGRGHPGWSDSSADRRCAVLLAIRRSDRGGPVRCTSPGSTSVTS